MTILAALALALHAAPLIRVEAVSSSPSLYERMGLQAVKNRADWVLLGGFDYPTRTCLREVSVLGRGGVERATEVRLAVGRNHFAAQSLGRDRVLVVGGYSEAFETLASVECLNVRTGASEAWPWLPDPVELFTSHRIGDRVAVIGGLVSQGKTRTLSGIQWIDLKTREAVRAPERLTTSRFGHASLVLRSGEVVIVGGKHVEAAPSRTLGSLSDLPEPPSPAPSPSAAQCIGTRGRGCWAGVPLYQGVASLCPSLRRGCPFGATYGLCPGRDGLLDDFRDRLGDHF